MDVYDVVEKKFMEFLGISFVFKRKRLGFFDGDVLVSVILI